MKLPTFPAAAVALALTLALAACGGGGSDTPAAAGSTLPAGDTSSVGTTTGSGSGGATVESSIDGTCGNSQMQAQLLSGINTLRAQAQTCGSEGSFGATTALTWNTTLFDAATMHSADMAANNYFSHVSPAGQTTQERLAAVGYDWSALAENIALGQTSVASVLAAWMASAGHCANMMGAAYRHVALSCVRNTAGSRYWTLNLARPIN